MKLLLLLVAGYVLAQDPKDIFKRAMEKDERNLSVLDTYMYERRTLERIYEKNGKLMETTEKVHEVFHVDGSEIERLVMKNGNALSEGDQESERKRVDKKIAKIKNESPKDRAKRRGETEKDKREEVEARRRCPGPRRNPPTPSPPPLFIGPRLHLPPGPTRPCRRTTANIPKNSA